MKMNSLVITFAAGAACVSLGLALAGDEKKPNDSSSAQTRETVAKPMTDKQRKKQEAKLRKELETPYKKWLNEDVTYIISDEEKAAFKRFATDEERQSFERGLLLVGDDVG